MRGSWRFTDGRITSMISSMSLDGLPPKRWTCVPRRFRCSHAIFTGPTPVRWGLCLRSSPRSTGTLGEVLRVAGNDVVLAVAYLRGGTQLVNTVSERLWPLVVETQLDVQHEGLATDRAAA
jgi:hypothetical protein